MKRTYRTTTAALAVASALVLSACGSEPQVAAPEPAPTPAPAPEQTAPTGEVLIRDPWARSLPNGMGSVYATLLSDVDDTLLSAEVVPGSIAMKVEVHEVVADDDGVMRMREMMAGLPLPAGVPVEMKPGGYHVMLMGMPEMLAPGSMFEVVLVFERAGRVSFPVMVADATAGSDGMMHGGDMMHGGQDDEGGVEGDAAEPEDLEAPRVSSGGGGGDALFF